VCSGVISDVESVQFCTSVPTRKCYSVDENEDNNGVCLRVCIVCFPRGERTSGKRVGRLCLSLLHPDVSTDKPAAALPGPACLPFLWGSNEAKLQRGLPPNQRKKVCAACKSRAEALSRNVAPPSPSQAHFNAVEDSAPPAPADTTPVRPSPPLTAGPDTSLVISPLSGFSVEPDSSTVPALLGAFVRRTGGDELVTRFPNGRQRVYRRVVTGRKVEVGSRQNRRRRAVAAATIQPLFPVAEATDMDGPMRIICGAARTTGAGVAPFHSLSVRQQLEFKVANRISGVTWTRIRAFLGGASSGLASREALRRDTDLAAGEERNRVTTSAAGAFLLSPRAAVQALLDDIVRSERFLECPVSEEWRSSRGREPTAVVAAADASGNTAAAASLSDSSDWADEQESECESSTSGGRVSPSGADDRGCGGGGGPSDLPPAAGDGSTCCRGGPSEPRSGVDGSGTPSGGERSAPCSDEGATTPNPAMPAVQLCFGMDKGGRQSTVKVYLGIANQPHPASVGNSIVLGVFPCKTDDYEALESICAVWLADIEELRANGLRVRGRQRSVCLIMTGDFLWMSMMSGHDGPSCRRPCLWCTALAWPTAKNAAEVQKFGCTQDGSRCNGRRRTARHAERMREAYANGDNKTRPTPLSPWRHLSIVRSPLLIIDPSDIAPMVLHLTLGITARLLLLAAETFAAERGEDGAPDFCAALGTLLREEAGVAPAPYFGGAFEGAECHRITRKLARVCDLLASRAPGPRADALRRSYALWDEIVPILNRATVIPVSEIAAFERATASFVDGLAEPFPWLRVSPKLHVLCCHAAPFLRRFGSLGRYSEQALEALHGQFNRDAERCTAPTFLGSCRAYVQLSALGRAPGADAHNNGPRRQSAAPGARVAKRTDDKRTRANRQAAGMIVSTDACREKQEADMAAWAEGLATRATTTIRAYNRRVQARLSTRPAPVGRPGAGSAAVTGESATVEGESTAAEVGGDDGLLDDADTDFFMGLLGWSFPGRD